MRRTIGAAMVALLFLASTLPAMCGQCEFAAAKLNCHASRKQAAASPEAASRAMTGEHCQHMANTQSGSASHLGSTGSCQDRPCQHLLDAATKTNRWDVAQLAHTLCTVVATEVSGDHDLIAKDSPRSRIEKPPLNASAYQPLSVNLRI
jgi:hypothetical protein